MTNDINCGTHSSTMEAPYSAAFPHIQSITKVGLKTIVVEMRIFGEQDEKKVDFFSFRSLDHGR